MLDIKKIRQQFPALGLKDDGKQRIYLDNPGGTQVPQQVFFHLALMPFILQFKTVISMPENRASVNNKCQTIISAIKI